MYITSFLFYEFLILFYLTLNICTWTCLMLSSNCMFCLHNSLKNTNNSVTSPVFVSGYFLAQQSIDDWQSSSDETMLLTCLRSVHMQSACCSYQSVGLCGPFQRQQRRLRHDGGFGLHDGVERPHLWTRRINALVFVSISYDGKTVCMFCFF